jgi:hypothetical protein
VPEICRFVVETPREMLKCNASISQFASRGWTRSGSLILAGSFFDVGNCVCDVQWSVLIKNRQLTSGAGFLEIGRVRFYFKRLLSPV